MHRPEAVGEARAAHLREDHLRHPRLADVAHPLRDRVLEQDPLDAREEDVSVNWIADATGALQISHHSPLPIGR